MAEADNGGHRGKSPTSPQRGGGIRVGERVKQGASDVREKLNTSTARSALPSPTVEEAGRFFNYAFTCIRVVLIIPVFI